MNASDHSSHRQSDAPGPEDLADSVDRSDQASQELLALWHPEYSELHVLPCLEGELPQRLWVAKRAAAHDPAILCDLSDTGPGMVSAELRYEHTTTLPVQHFGVPEVIDARSPEALYPYVAWAVTGGYTLRSLLADGEYPQQRRVLQAVRSLAETVAELHRFGHTVAGLSPAVVWLGPGGVTQILGLGLHAFDASTSKGAGLRYRAPEQLRREPLSMAQRLLASDYRERADIWALGMILLELIDHRPRLSSASPQELLDELNDADLSPSAVGTSPELEELLERMLTRDVEQRIITADEISEALDDLLASGSPRTVSRDDPQAASPAEAESAYTRSSFAPSSAGGQPTQGGPTPAQEPVDDWSWRRAIRDLEDRRKSFDESPSAPDWKVWLLPIFALGFLAAMIWLLIGLGS